MANIIASYSESNENVADALNNSIIGYGQSFTGNGSTLGSAIFYMNKSSTPTGTATAKIYAHSGTFGVNSIPTGAALATSNTLDVSTLTTTLTLKTFIFADTNQITLTNGTNYVVTVEYSGGTASKTVNVGVDTTSPTAPGNFSSLTGTTWTPANTIDVCFYVTDNGIAPITDTTAISETKSITVTNFINVNDTTATSEHLTFFPDVSVSDIVNTTESTAEIVVKLINVADAINTDDFINVQDFELVVKDTVNIANVIIQNSFEMCADGVNTQGLLNSYVEVLEVATRLNTASFDGTVNYYFEADIFNQTNNGGTAFARLYNHTDGVFVPGSAVSAGFNSGETVRVRSGPLSLAGDKIYTVQLRDDTQGTAGSVIYGARIIITQSGVITKTEIHQYLGSESSVSSNSSTNLMNHAGQFLYNASDYDGSITVRYDANLKADSLGNAAFSSLYDNTAGSVLSGSIATTTSSSYTLISTSSLTLTDGHVYIPTAYVAGVTPPSNNFEGSYVVLTITNFTKFLQYLMVSNQGLVGYATTSTSYSSSIGAADSRPAYSTTNFLNSHVTYYYESVLNTNVSAQTAFSQLAIYDNTLQTLISVSGTEVSITGTGIQTRARSSAFTIPVDGYTFADGVIGNEYGFQMKTSNSSATTTVHKAYLILAVNGIGSNTGEFVNVAIAYLINVSDTVTSSESRTVFIPFLVPSISDTAATSESLKLLVDGNINKSDSTSISESIGLFVTSIAASDTVVTSELVNVNSAYTINLSDSSATSEFINRTLVININVSDSITASEDFVVNALHVVVSNTAATSEFIDPEVNSFVSKSDTSVTSESTNIAQVDTFAVSDATTTAEITTSFIPELFSTVSDTTTTSENIILNELALPIVSDTLTTNESIVAQEISFFIPFYNLGVSDVINTSDIPGVITSGNLFDITLADTVSIAEFIFTPTEATLFLEVIYIPIILHTAISITLTVPATNVIDLVVK